MSYKPLKNGYTSELIVQTPVMHVRPQISVSQFHCGLKLGNIRIGDLKYLYDSHYSNLLKFDN